MQQKDVLGVAGTKLFPPVVGLNVDMVDISIVVTEVVS